MINRGLVNAALRARGVALVVCTTGSTSLSAIAAGYARASGSFINDGFVQGMEVVPSAGWTSATPGLVTLVADKLLTIRGGLTPQSAGARSLSVGLPALQYYDNDKFTPQQFRWFAEGEFSPSTSTLQTATASRGIGQATGEYYWRLYSVAETGDDALDAVTSALLRCYPPGDGQRLSDGTTLRIRQDIAPWAGSITNETTGHAVLTVTVPWRCSFTNPVL